MEDANKTKPPKDVVPEKGGVKVGDVPAKGNLNAKGPEKGGGDKSFYSRFLSAISSPAEAPSSSQPGSRTTRSQPADQDDLSSSGLSEDEDVLAPPVQAPSKAPAPKEPEGKGKSQAASRNTRLRQFLALDDLSPMTSSDEEGIVPPLKPPPKAPAAATKAPEAKRGRGRPPTTGEYVGLADAKRALVEAQRAELQLQTEKEIVERASAMATARVTRSQTGITLASHQAPPEARVAHAEGLQRQIADSLAVVTGVAKVSKGLKGTLQKALKEAAAAIQEASEELLGRTNSEEVALLRAANGRMEAEIADLRSELRSLQAELTRPRAEVAQPVTPPNLESAMAANLERMTLVMESRFAAMEEQMRSARLAPSPALALSPAPQARPTSLPTSPSLLPGLSVEEYPPLPQRGKKEKAVAKSTPPPPACPAPLPSSAEAEQGWTTVSRKKAGKKANQPSSGTQPTTAAAGAQTTRAQRRRGRGRGGKGQGDVAQAPASQPPPPPPPAPKKKEIAKEKRSPRLRAPKSAAVVLTLQPGAADRGVTFANLFSKAKANIRLADLGIEGGVRLKCARTGARMLVLPGADTAPKADALAEQLRTVLYPEDVRVSRPEKTVCLRVSGLDDHVHEEHVAAAIARTTGCPVGGIKASKVRPGPDGLGQTVVACPVAAAKKLLSEGTKLLVGWSSALVKALPHRTQRCYRCHEAGHVAAVCTSEVDRSGHCYRCGQVGHLVSGPCTAKPHCPVCAAAGKPAGHQLGSRPCGAKPTRGRRQASRTTAPDRAAAAAATTSAAAPSGKE
ncbi:hypothetical protein K1T71_001557 [Dendrolimus kikuchii]|uniref:Uncharacterized protein n=1 Tax=Dendrolimus kikuchii TaxID=765133 RepID=A0ACC1DEY1_9NEOP|nr:hypothetical protein K1T71_001557 [Dendrolimus kikuchii]